MVFKFVYKPQEKNLFSTMMLSLFLAGAIFIFACIWMFGLLFSIWTEGTVYFIKKDNPKTKIISRYINEGAFGGGTEPSDYHIVLHRPILGIYKMETSIDTSSINKAGWINPN